VAELAISKATYAEIARACGISRATVKRDVAAVRQEWREARLRNADEVIGEELHTLSLMQQELMPLIRERRLPAFDRLISVMRRRAALLGLDAPDGHLVGAAVEHRTADGRPLSDQEIVERATLAERVIAMVEREFPDPPELEAASEFEADEDQES
jgi:hypothetical protein